MLIRHVAQVFRGYRVNRTPQSDMADSSLILSPGDGRPQYAYSSAGTVLPDVDNENDGLQMAELATIA